MKINQDTVNGIIENAKVANEGIYKELCLDANFRERFHLRPKRGEITIVSTLSAAPMWGKSVKKEKLEETLKKLKSRLKDFYSVNLDKVRDALHDLEYNTDRKTDDSRLEANVQAEFIQGMLAGQQDYKGIKFVASELTLGKESRDTEGKTSRFDVVGIKGKTLYIFELKRDRTSIIEQVVDYVTLVNTNKDAFRDVLRVYPNHAVGDWDKVKGIMVMAHAVNVDKNIDEKAKKIGVELWYYEPALRFKLKGK